MAAAGRAGLSYAELYAQSAFSFLRGASEPEALVERVRKMYLARREPG